MSTRFGDSTPIRPSRCRLPNGNALRSQSQATSRRDRAFSAASVTVIGKADRLLRVDAVTVHRSL